jgi:hypothetical protein
MSDTPLISICMPNLNKRPFLEQCMESLLAQAYRRLEIIVCDSYSDDGSWELLQRFRGDPRVQLHQVPRAGLYAGWNECLRRATGDYIYMATSDDFATAEAVERLVEPLESHPDIHLAVCDFESVDEFSRPISHPRPAVVRFAWEHSTDCVVRSSAAEFLMTAVAGTVWVTMNSVLFRKSLLESVGPFRTDQGALADTDWSLRASLLTDVAIVPEKLVSWRVHENQATSKRMSAPELGTLCESLESVLRDPTVEIPASWKEKPDWNGEMTRARRLSYLHALGLYRWEARARPLQFLRQALEALRREPAFLFRKMVGGFSVGEESNPDYVAITKRLFELFEVDWPPRRRWK